jgi:hypothetical protein
MSVNSISFSVHVDYTQNSQFIDEVKAPHVVGFILFDQLCFGLDDEGFEELYVLYVRSEFMSIWNGHMSVRNGLCLVILVMR